MSNIEPSEFSPVSLIQSVSGTSRDVYIGGTLTTNNGFWYDTHGGIGVNYNINIGGILTNI